MDLRIVPEELDSPAFSTEQSTMIDTNTLAFTFVVPSNPAHAGDPAKLTLELTDYDVRFRHTPAMRRVSAVAFALNAAYQHGSLASHARTDDLKGRLNSIREIIADDNKRPLQQLAEIEDIIVGVPGYAETDDPRPRSL